MKFSVSPSALILAAACLIAPAVALAHGHAPGGRFFEKIDKNSDGAITRTEARDAAKSRFSEIDENRDNVVTRPEAEKHAAARFEKHHPTPEQRKQRFDEADKNKNGKLERSESHMPDKWFEKADADRDGAVTLAELEAAFAAFKKKHGSEKAQSRMAEHVNRHFEKVDSNKDGKMTWPEARDHEDARFTQMDKNGDKKVTREEAKAHLDAMRASHGKHAGGRGHGRGHSTDCGADDSKQAQ